MKLLYAPWRGQYSGSTHKRENAKEKDDTCVFCAQIASNRDEHYFIIKRYEHVFVVLNHYPYNAGHIMVIPYIHKAHLADIEREARHELMDVVSSGVQVIQKSLKADGVNVGLNLGKAAGGSIANHVHMHIVPRWQGDTNFIPVTADTKVISFDMHEIYQLLRAGFQEG